MKTKLIVAFIAVLISIIACGQVGIGTTNPHPSSILHLSSTNKGLLLPAFLYHQ
ncbi:hypothetical protein [Chryseobacterium taihuense]|uniref:hypothetical protein n=1 Tax=Chryseobacterium taihuense TaxID=1141221 RepID=UPI0015A27235|nr:hypothetical protein [Chryseobacterium taihuense]